MKNKISINLEVSLVEIIFSILIFAIAGAIILYCFAAARLTQIKANDKVEAGNLIQSNVEIIKYFESSVEMDEYLFNNFKHQKVNGENIYINYFDKEWNLCDEKSKEYLITVKVNDASSKSGVIKEIVIIAEREKSYPFIDNNNEQNYIYEIKTKKFFPNNEGRW